MRVESDGAESGSHPARTRKWLYALPAFLILGLIWFVAELVQTESFDNYTTPPIAPTGKRVRLLIPAGWEMRPWSGSETVHVEPTPRYEWLQYRPIRRWLKLDETERVASLLIGVRPFSGGTKGLATKETDGIWIAGIQQKYGKYDLTIAYLRTDKRAFDRTYKRVLQSARILN